MSFMSKKKNPQNTTFVEHYIKCETKNFQKNELVYSVINKYKNTYNNNLTEISLEQVKYLENNTPTKFVQTHTRERQSNPMVHYCSNLPNQKQFGYMFDDMGPFNCENIYANSSIIQIKTKRYTMLPTHKYTEINKYPYLFPNQTGYYTNCQETHEKLSILMYARHLMLIPQMNFRFGLEWILDWGNIYRQSQINLKRKSRIKKTGYQ